MDLLWNRMNGFQLFQKRSNRSNINYENAELPECVDKSACMCMDAKRQSGYSEAISVTVRVLSNNMGAPFTLKTCKLIVCDPTFNECVRNSTCPVTV
jgi:hypothetical protein